MDIEALERAIKITGGQSRLARELLKITGRKIGQGHIWSWLNRSKSVPAEYAIPIELATRGKVRREDIRPDIYPRKRVSRKASN